MSQHRKKILFDLMAAQPNQAKYHGASEYAKTVFLKLSSVNHGREVVGVYDPNRPLPKILRESASIGNIELTPCRDLQALQQILNSGTFDKFYSALPYKYNMLQAPNVTFILTIHGLRDIECPADRYEIKYLHSRSDVRKFISKRIAPIRYKREKAETLRSLLKVDCKGLTVVVPSRHTKYSLFLESHDLPKVRVLVLSSPVRAQHETAALSEIGGFRDKYGLATRGFILLASGGRWIKNAYRATKALDRLFSMGLLPGRSVVISGVSRQQKQRFGVSNPDRFVFLDYMSDKHLSWLYAHAFAFVYPSLNEGYGYPPVEAMKYGTPVLAAANTSITEVCGDAAMYFDGRDERELSVRIITLAEEAGLWEHLSQRAVKRYGELYSQQKKDLEELCGVILN
jgi:glycosyltransferase involved in cell wall biosynthesis